MSQRMHLCNNVRSSYIQDPDILDWINKVFKLPNLSSGKISVLRPMQERKLNSFEINFDFGFDFDYSSSLVIQSKRMKIRNSIYHSKDYNRVGPKTANYIISFHSNNLICYGIIYYFLKISTNIFIAVKELKKTSNLFDNLGARTSMEIIRIRNTGIFNQYYCNCIELDTLIFIHSSQVINKCLAKRNNDNYIEALSQLEVITPHD